VQLVNDKTVGHYCQQVDPSELEKPVAGAGVLKGVGFGEYGRSAGVKGVKI
jgi:hypothetical protein